MKPKPLLIILIALLLAVFFVGYFLRTQHTPKNGVKHIVLVIFDALRADRLSLYGHTKPTTPYLDAHKDSFLVFKRARAAAPWTVPSHASMFTGKVPAEHLADWGNMRLHDSHETTAESLSKAGFCTSAFVANHLFKKDKPNLLQGFQSVYYPKKDKRQERILRKLAAALHQTADSKCRRFIFISFMNNHLPYDPGPYAAEFGVKEGSHIDNSAIKWNINAGVIPFSPNDKENHRRLYDASVRYSDELIERLIDLLSAHGLLENSLLAITSDHGDGLGYHAELGHEIAVWEEQLAVPLIVRFPGKTAGGREISEMVSLVGLHPFIKKAAFSGKAAAQEVVKVLVDNSMNGLAEYRSYFGEQNRKLNQRYAEKYPHLAKRVQHRHILYCGDYKLHAHADGAFSFYNIETDPAETKVLQTGFQAEFQSCRERYERLLAQGRFTPFDYLHLKQEEHFADDSDLEALKTLGYL